MRSRATGEGRSARRSRGDAGRGGRARPRTWACRVDRRAGRTGSRRGRRRARRRRTSRRSTRTMRACPTEGWRAPAREGRGGTRGGVRTRRITRGCPRSREPSDGKVASGSRSHPHVHGRHEVRPPRGTARDAAGRYLSRRAQARATANTRLAAEPRVVHDRTMKACCRVFR